MCRLVRDRHIQIEGEREREKKSSSSSWPREPRESTSELGSTQLESLPGTGWNKNPCLCGSACVLTDELGCLRIFVHEA